MRDAEAFRSGSADPADRIREVCGRIEEAEPGLRVLLPEPGRRERLEREARALAARFPDPASRPPLYGLLVGVKDIFNADGFETRAGSRLPPEEFKGPESAALAALKAAGALVLGKTVTTEFAFFAPGPTRNPWDLGRTPGGSSSGSAAGAAAGFFHLALGTQTIGSITRPAAFCGIAGWKPSYGRVSAAGVFPFSPSVDHIGLLAPDARALALGAAVLCEGWRGLPSPVRKPVLALPEGPFLEQASPEARERFERSVAVLSAAGWKVLRVPAFRDIEEINARHRRIAAAEMYRTHSELFSPVRTAVRPRHPEPDPGRPWDTGGSTDRGPGRPFRSSPGVGRSPRRRGRGHMDLALRTRARPRGPGLHRQSGHEPALDPRRPAHLVPACGDLPERPALGAPGGGAVRRG
ncbi:MAG: amidase family protein [Anaerotruncus sp.]|nr:amidase family protein [Anaerotruncus sp.]